MSGTGRVPGPRGETHKAKRNCFHSPSEFLIERTPDFITSRMLSIYQQQQHKHKVESSVATLATDSVCAHGGHPSEESRHVSTVWSQAIYSAVRSNRRHHALYSRHYSRGPQRTRKGETQPRLATWVASSDLMWASFAASRCCVESSVSSMRSTLELVR
jgi:hypothetical protein